MSKAESWRVTVKGETWESASVAEKTYRECPVLNTSLGTCALSAVKDGLMVETFQLKVFEVRLEVSRPH